MTLSGLFWVSALYGNADIIDDFVDRVPLCMSPALRWAELATLHLDIESIESIHCLVGAIQDMRKDVFEKAC